MKLRKLASRWSVPGVALELFAAGALAVWPERKWIAWALFALGLVLIAVHVVRALLAKPEIVSETPTVGIDLGDVENSAIIGQHVSGFDVGLQAKTLKGSLIANTYISGCKDGIKA